MHIPSRYCVALSLLTSCVACTNDKPKSSDVRGVDLETPLILYYDRESGDGLMNVSIRDTSHEHGSFTGSEYVDLGGSDRISALINGNTVGFQRVTQGEYEASFKTNEFATFQFIFSRGTRDFIYYGEFLSEVEFGLTLAETDLAIGQSVDLDIVLDPQTGEESSSSGGSVRLHSADYSCTLPSGEMRNGTGIHDSLPREDVFAQSTPSRDRISRLVSVLAPNAVEGLVSEGYTCSFQNVLRFVGTLSDNSPLVQTFVDDPSRPLGIGLDVLSGRSTATVHP